MPNNFEPPEIIQEKKREQAIIAERERQQKILDNLRRIQTINKEIRNQEFPQVDLPGVQSQLDELVSDLPEDTQDIVERKITAALSAEAAAGIRERNIARSPKLREILAQKGEIPVSKVVVPEGKEFKPEVTVKEGDEVEPGVSDQLTSKAVTDLRQDLLTPKTTKILRELSREKRLEFVKQLPGETWRELTPWDESSETFGEFVLNTPKRMKDITPPDQEKLKAQFEAEQEAATWSKVLFGKSVIYDKKTDKYYPLLASIGVEVGPAKLGKAAIKATRKATKTIEVNWNKVLKQAKKDKASVDWKKLEDAIAAGKVKDAAGADKFAKAHPAKHKSFKISEKRKGQVPPPAKSKPRPERKVKVRDERAIHQTAEEFAKQQKIGTDILKRAEEVGAFNKLVRETLGQSAKAATASATLARLKQARALLLSTSPLLYGLTRTQIKNSTLTKSEQKELIKISEELQEQEKTQAETAVKAATYEQVKAQNKAKELTDQLTEAESKIKTTPITETDPATGQKTITTIETTTDAALEPVAKTEKAREISPTRPPVKTPVTTPIKLPIKPPVKPPGEPPITPPPPRIRLKDGKTPKKKWTPEQVRSAIAWKDGFVVHALKSPYRRKIDAQTFHVDNLPDGLKVLDIKGKGSQEASARVTGKFPARLTVDVGNQDVIISRTRGNRVRMRHTRDTRKSVSRTTISKKQGRIFKTKIGGSTVLSRRPLKGV